MVMHTTKKYKVILGRGEPVTFLDYDLVSVPAKVDSGAYRSAVHASDIKISKDGKSLSFVLLKGHPICTEPSPVITTKDFKEVEVENSFGHKETRYEIKLRVLVGGKKFTTSFTLANRTKKGFPILIGRRLLNRRFMVDTSHTNVDRVKIKSAYKKATGITLEIH
jgi:hypothetical protein